jgi:hypothetical protein
MKCGIDSFKDLIELISWVVGAISLAVAAFTYSLGKSHFNFAVITNCVERFQLIITRLRSANGEERIDALKRYVDLCNEELFYFKNKYIPEEVIDEWLEGMIYYLPLYSKSYNVYIKSAYAPDIVDHDLLKDYPRIKRSFSVYKKYDLSSESDRKSLIKEIKHNLRHSTI